MKKNIIILFTVIVAFALVTLLATNIINSNSIIDNNKLDDGQVEQQVCEKKYSFMYNDKYIYKAIASNKEGVKVYDNYYSENQKVVDTIKYGEEIRIVADVIDEDQFYLDNKKYFYNNFDEIKKYYYFAIDVCGEPKYVKYSDVSIIDSSVASSEKFGNTQKFYMYNDEYLFSGPGLSFEKDSEDEKIPKGTILDVNLYSRIGNALWLYVTYNGHNGWLLEDYYNSVNYPYNNMKYGSATLITELKGDIILENESNLYMYAFSTEEIILKIPSGTKVSYDYSVSEPGIIYYHVNYNNHSGWIIVYS